MSSFTETDKILINRGGVDYQTTLAELREYVNAKPPMPWDDYFGAVLHVKDATGTVTLDLPHDVYELDGTFKGNLKTFGPGEELVFLVPPTMTALLFKNNTDTTWNFGELTDVSTAKVFDSTFENCNSFNGTGMSDWDTSSVENMAFMFNGCSNFNQDLSQWCVSKITSLPRRFDGECNAWEEKNKPCWGHCPRGEHGLGEDPCPKLPWEEHVDNGGVVLHVKDATGTVGFRNGDVYEIDGTFKGNIHSFDPGEEVVILIGEDLARFFEDNRDTTWNFGELTDVSNAHKFGYMFEGCNSFNGTGMSDWNTFNVEGMHYMFRWCENFNQDLSQWCTRRLLIGGHNGFADGCASWEAENMPVWGTCPGGEDRP